MWGDVAVGGGLTAQVNRYLRGDGVDELWAKQVVNGPVSWYVTDAQGSVLGQVDDLGKVGSNVLYRGGRAVVRQRRPSWLSNLYEYTGRPFDVFDPVFRYNGQHYGL